jgi:hypothetical protein
LLIHYPHAHASDQKQGLHYNALWDLQLIATERNQTFAGPDGPAKAKIRGESAKFG